MFQTTNQECSYPKNMDFMGVTWPIPIWGWLNHWTRIRSHVKNPAIARNEQPLTHWFAATKDTEKWWFQEQVISFEMMVFELPLLRIYLAYESFWIIINPIKIPYHDKVIPIPIKKNINHVIPLKSHYINPIRIIHVLFPLYHHCHVLAWRHLRPRPPCLRSNSQASVLNERNGGVNNNGSTQPKNGWNMDEIRMT